MFESSSPSFVAGDTNGVTDVFVKDRFDGAVTRVSVATPLKGIAFQGNGASGSAASGGSVISGDGRLVAFTSVATNLAAEGDTNGVADVFVHDRVTKVTRRVSLNAAGQQLSGASVHGALSTDGRYLTFQTVSANVVPGVSGSHVYRVRLDGGTPTVELVSQNSKGAPGDNSSLTSAISADGRQVAFESLASNLDLGAADNNRAIDIFVRDMQSKRTARVSVQTDGFQTISGPFNLALTANPAISGNGRYVSFTVAPQMKLVSNDNNSLEDVYVRDRDVDNNGVMDEVVDGFESLTVRTFRVSVNTSGADADGPSSNPALSVDGRFVSFMSYATNLVTPARDEQFRYVYVRDLDTDRDGVLEEPGTAVTSLVSITTGGQPADRVLSGPARMSSNGRFIVFPSDGTNLDSVLVDTNRATDVFVHDHQAVAVMTAPGARAALSGNGRYLAFESAEPLVTGDSNGLSDVFVRNFGNGTVVRVSVSSSGAQANGQSIAAAMSTTGRFVVFESDASNLVAGDTNGVRDVFLRDRDADGNGTYDQPGGVTTVLVSRTAGGALGTGASSAASISGDGRYVAFASDAPNMVFGDTNGLRDIFLRDRLEPVVGLQLRRVSVSSTGAQQLGGASDRPRVSADGRYVAYESTATNLVVNDSNGVRDVFVRDLVGGTTTRVSLTSTGQQADESSSGAAISTNGGRVVFVSSEAMVSGDVNGAPDIYGRPVTGGTTGRESVTSLGEGASGGSGGAAISADGRFVAYTTNSTNLSALDPNSNDDVYVRDRQTNQVRLLSVPTPGSSARSFDATLSANGRTVAFSTEPDGAVTSASLRSARAAAETTSITVQFAAPIDTSLSPAQGPANATTVVQISGAGLAATTKVFFGGFVGSGLSVLDDDTVVVTAPARPAGPVDVDVEIAGFQVNTVGVFTYGETAPGVPTPPCTTVAQTATPNLAQAGGQAAVNVTTPAECSWTAAETVEWLAVSDPGAATGPGAFQVTAAQNVNPAQRSGSVVVNGVELAFTQAGTGCETFTVEPANRRREVPHLAGQGAGVSIAIGPGCPWTATADVPWLHVSGGSGSGAVQYSVDVNPDVFDRHGTLTVQGVPVVITQLAAPQPTPCTYTLSPATVSVGAAAGGGSFTVTPSGSCAWSAQSEADWIALTPPATGTGVGVVSFQTLANIAGNRSGTIEVGGERVTVAQAGPSGQAPFGFVDQPLDGLTDVKGAIALTGWALDDAVVTELMICRLTVPGETWVSNGRCNGALNEVYVGSGVFIRGARPDVQNAYPTTPGNDRAGWGFLLLTNQLPGSNGTFTFVFRARDGVDRTNSAGQPIEFVPGNVTELARRTMTVNNLTATIPFGTIDTPGQGERISGADYVNFGWALTPQPKTIPKDGSTIRVILDGVVIGTVTYNNYRQDVSSLFPGLNNTGGPGPGQGGPVGFLRFDTRVLSNGLHTIAWFVADDAGAVEGLGSRFFEVQNGPAPASSATDQSGVTVAAERLPVSAAPVWLARHPDGRPVSIRADRAGTRHVALRATDIAYLSLGGATGTPYEGYVADANTLRPLPAGSSLDSDTGLFAWQLGPGFVGVYDLLFVRTVDGRREGIPVRVVVQPQSVAAARPLVVTEPTDGTLVTSPFTITGRAVTGAAQALRDVFVYAYPTDGSAPVFVGETSVKGSAVPTAAAAFGGQFAHAEFAVAVTDLPAGSYDLLIVGRSGVSAALDTALWVGPITVR